jgi:glucoamylase
MIRGQPTGAAMPLCWSHAEYISLVRSVRDGVCFDRIEPAYQRYVVHPSSSRHEIWSARHPIRFMPHGKILRIITAANATIIWTADGWLHANKTATERNATLNVPFADFETQGHPSNSSIEFTFFWTESQSWEGRNYVVAVRESPSVTDRP